MTPNGKKILLVDDDSTIRTLYSDFFTKNGFSVVEHNSALDALELLASGKKFDIVITDIMMAKMDGWELLDTVRETMQLTDVQLPVIVASAFESDTLEMKAFRHGANGSFVKGKDSLTKLLRMVCVQTGLERSKYSE